MAIGRRLALLGLAVALSLVGATTASAATEVGDECEGNEASGLYSLVPEQHALSRGAAYQTACPVVELSVRTVRKRKSLRLLVTASMGAEVTVYGQAMWGFKPKRKDLGKRNLIVPLYGGTKAVAAGQPTRFPIRYSKEVKRRLSRITAKESIRTRITVTAPNLAGAPTTRILKPRLHGWMRRR